MKIPMPAGFEAPKGTEPGAAFDAVASIAIAEDGMLEILSLDGAPLDAKPKKPSKGEEPDTDDAAEAPPKNGPMRSMSAKGMEMPWDT